MSDSPTESRSDSRDAAARFQHLVEIMRTLRSEHGCAWDRQQTLKTLRPFVLQETYELLDALDRGDYQALEHELGDFLFEAVFLAQICEEEGRFSIADSITAIADKLVRRHPHIFDERGLPAVASAEAGKASLTPKQVKEQWEEIKAQERKDAGESAKTVLSGVPRSMPSLLRAYELSTRAAMVGFDWVTTDDVIDKAEEEIRELREAVADQRQDLAGKLKRSLATCCSPWSTSHASWVSSRKPRCGSRTTSSNGGSTISNGKSRLTGTRSAT